MLQSVQLANSHTSAIKMLLMQLEAAAHPAKHARGVPCQLNHRLWQDQQTGATIVHPKTLPVTLLFRGPKHDPLGVLLP